MGGLTAGDGARGEPRTRASRRVDPHSPVPKHSQVRSVLLDVITELDAEDAIPSERELSRQLGVARMTVRQAVELLVTEGRLFRVAGRGTFVAPHKVRLPMRLSSFTTDMSSRGMRPATRVIQQRTAPAGRALAALLGIPVNATVHVVERLRLADEIPMAIERTHIPTALAPGLLAYDLTHRSLYALLGEFGLTPESGTESVEAVAAGSEDAALLGIREGSPILLLERVTRNGDRPVEYVAARYRGDRYQLRAAIVSPTTPPSTAPSNKR